jgi:hypothetical protein
MQTSSPKRAEIPLPPERFHLVIDIYNAGELPEPAGELLHSLQGLRVYILAVKRDVPGARRKNRRAPGCAWSSIA